MVTISHGILSMQSFLIHYAWLKDDWFTMQKSQDIVNLVSFCTTINKGEKFILPMLNLSLPCSNDRYSVCSPLFVWVFIWFWLMILCQQAIFPLIIVIYTTTSFKDGHWDFPYIILDLVLHSGFSATSRHSDFNFGIYFRFSKNQFIFQMPLHVLIT